MGTLKTRITNFKDRLLRINEREPLSKLSLLIIIALDIFILIILFQGLSSHTKQLTSPYEYVQGDCRQIFIDDTWSESNRIDQLQRIVLTDYNNYLYRSSGNSFSDDELNKMHPICKKIFIMIKGIAENKELLGLFKRRQKLVNDRDDLTRAFKQTKDVYDTSVLEKIAQEEKDIRLHTIKSSVKKKENNLEQISISISEIDEKINTHPLVLELWALSNKGPNEYRGILVKELNKFEFWYPLKELAWQLLFMLPLFIIFYLWHSKSISKNNSLQVFVSSHLLVIASIPVLIKIIDVVLELIPQHFFKKLFKLLELFHLIAIWHYLVIMLSILLAFLFIYIIQKKLFNEQRLRKQRLSKGQCYLCAKKLSYNVHICPFCGTNQYKSCSSCNKGTFVCGDYCIHCGRRF